MAETPAPLRFNTDFDPRTGTVIPLFPGVRRLTAPNKGPYTFTGTNTYLLSDSTVAVVDPGPDDQRHLNALIAAIGGRKVEAIILTHTHKDHSALVRRLQASTGSPPLWFGGRHRTSRPKRPFEVNGVASDSDWGLVPDRILQDGEIAEVAGLRLEVVATPGHCANHLCFGVAGTEHLLSGDHVMGWNSTLVPVPDGAMADYFRSLERLIALPYRTYHPGHGGPIEKGPDYAAALLRHRQQRNRQVVDAVRNGARTVQDLLQAIYPKLSLQLIPAARMTLAAHIECLEETGAIRVRRGLLGLRLSPAAP